MELLCLTQVRSESGEYSYLPTTYSYLAQLLATIQVRTGLVCDLDIKLSQNKRYSAGGELYYEGELYYDLSF